MVEPLKPHEFDKIRAMLESVCGIVLKNDQDYLVETRLTELANEIGVADFGEFHRKVIVNESLLARVVDAMTTNETLWFRDDSCWKTLGEKIIPDLIKKIKNDQTTVRIWSAASSTGQEPYSLSILIDELTQQFGNQGLSSKFQIIATDISPTVLETAKKAKYDPFTIGRGLSKTRLEKYFIKGINHWELKPNIQSRVEFRKFNLMESFFLLGKFDLVLCRNVAIYFSNDFKQDLFKKISMALNPGGVMILGATESLFGLKTNYESLSFETGMYHRVKL